MFPLANPWPYLSRENFEKIKYYSKFMSNQWDGIPRETLISLICDRVEARSEAYLLTRELLKSGDFVVHPQLGLITREQLELLIQWAERDPHEEP
jgi:hypothetical protein